MPERAWIDEARALRAEGLSYRKIGERFGVHETTVWAALNPEAARESARRDNAKRHEAKKAWQRRCDRSPEGRGRCVVCGGPMGVGSARAGYRRCGACVEAQIPTIVRLWNEEHLTASEIALRLGWKPASVSARVSELRAEGVEMEYRRPPSMVEVGRRMAEARWGA